MDVSRTIPSLTRMFELKHGENFMKATTMTSVLARPAESRRTMADGLNMRHINVGVKYRLCGMKMEGPA